MSSSLQIPASCSICRFSRNQACFECDLKAGQIQCYWAFKPFECDHEYHLHCIQRWFKNRHECPVCQAAQIQVEGTAK